jgi:hypothetical protein
MKFKHLSYKLLAEAINPITGEETTAPDFHSYKEILTGKIPA